MMPILESFNPLDQSIVGQVPYATPEQITQAVSVARDAQRAWAKQSIEQRSAEIVSAYQQLSSVVEELSLLISLEMGKDRRRAGYEAQGAVHSAGYLVEEASDAFRSESLGNRSELQYRPLGVVAVISPWNYPLAMANNLIIPALLAGNSVILKPSEHTPLVADLFVRTLQQYLPEGVLQILHGRGDVGQALVTSDINMVAFTGSVQAGRDIMRNAAPKLKRLVMELGGNDPMIVMHNADVAAAARFAVASSFENAGQMCTSTERIYVDQRVAQAFYREVVHVAGHYQTGAWDKPGVNIGPLANPSQFEKVLDHLTDAEAKGAKFLLGSSEHQAPFIQPTVVTGITPDMRLESEETFGPVVAMAEFQDIDEAIRRANDSIYGLGAVVFGGQGAQAVAQQLEAGMVAVNQGAGGSPWVGAKQSGFGFHGSKAGHRQFTQVRVINF